MEKPSDPVRILRRLRGSVESRSLLLTTLTEAAQLWRQTGSLAAYLVVFSALDSNDSEIRQPAEKSLNRSSPRPANHRTNSSSATVRRAARWKESA
jgi:hypothetical protein